jgi:diguanylate cyclase (GGDEF)-like protein
LSETTSPTPDQPNPSDALVALGAPSSSKRVLIHEILTLQLLITGVIGALAIASLYWGGQWVLQNNYARWALQWTEELHELGAPLYVYQDDAVTRRLESYINKYPEIERVTYYRVDGSPLFSISTTDDSPSEDRPLSPEKLESASQMVGTPAPYVIESSILNVRAFQIYAPIWTESITSDGMFDFDPLAEAPASSKDLLGFVGLELDFVGFHNLLLSNIKITITILVFLLMVSGVGGRLLLRRALRSISDLQQPIAELARGNLEVQFKPAAHREIAEIVEALQTTAAALAERDAKLSELANHDALTGLYNRRRFVDELKKELLNVADRNGHSALLFIDLDQFKYVNDIAGHPAGDRLIQKVADLLTQTVGENGVVGRFGGDEFAVIIGNVTKSDTQSAAQSILDAMRQLVHVEAGRTFHIHCSIGITFIQPGNCDHDDLIAQADIACREAKLRGRNRLSFYQSSEHETQKVVADVGWMTKIRDAIDDGSFVLHYQPIVEIATGITNHHEVLLRMRSDHGDLIAPDAFLPAAVRFGLMAEVDAWVIENSIIALSKYLNDDPNLRFSINLSANAFEMEDLASFVESLLSKYQVPAARVLFEITESLAIRQLSNNESQIATLREMGCEFALDDFGTGYSSFSHLRQLSVDYIKIDGIFITNMVDEPIDQKTVELIGEIGKAAGMKTVAEHVDSGPALALLRKLGIDYAQGRYIAEPNEVPTSKSIPIPVPAPRRSIP